MAINLDGVGFASHEPGSQQSLLGLEAPDTGDFLAMIVPGFAAEEASKAVSMGSTLPEPLQIVGVVAPDDAHYPLTYPLLRSDHAPFWKAGIPGVFLTDTANYRNPNYHMESDTPDTLDDAFLLGAGRFTAGLAAAYASLP
jgi:hypothetical protein